MGLLAISLCSGTAATAAAFTTAAAVVLLVAPIALASEPGGTPDATSAVDGPGVPFV